MSYLKAERYNYDGPPGMKVVPALAIVAIFWILAHATFREFLVTGIVLVLSSVLYFARMGFRRKA